MKNLILLPIIMLGFMSSLCAQVSADGVYFQIGSCCKKYQYGKEGTISLPDYHDYHLPLNDTTILVISVLDVKDNLFEVPSSLPTNNIFSCENRTITREIVDAVNHAEKMAYVAEKTASGLKVSKVYELALWSRSDKYFSYIDAVHELFHDFQKPSPENTTIGFNAQVPVQFTADIEVGCLKGLQYTETTSFEIGKGNLLLTFLPDVGLYTRHNDDGAQQLLYIGDAPIGPFIEVLCDNQKTVFAPIENVPALPTVPTNPIVIANKTSPLVPETVDSGDPDFQIVKAGDGLKALAMENGVTTANLIEWNNITDPNEALKPGRKLRIAPPASQPSKPVPLPEPVTPMVEAKPIEIAKPAAPLITNPVLETVQPAITPVTPKAVSPASPEVPSYKADENGEYVTVAGDNLFKIAKGFGVSADDLSAWNNLGGKPIMVGRKLRVTPPVNVGPKTQSVAPAPAKAASPDEYVVKSGESIFDVTQKFGVSIGDLINWNNLSSTMISPGTKLKVAAPKESAKPLTPVVDVADKSIPKQATVTPKPTAAVAPKPATVTPAPAPAAQSDTWVLHTVKAKENLFNIAPQYQATAKQLREWNSLKVDALTEGQVLKVGKKAAAPATPAVVNPTPSAPSKPKIPANGIYTAVEGDSVHQVAVRFGLQDDQIISWNGLTDYKLNAGQKVKLTANADATASPAPTKPVVPATAKTHTVAAGETLLQVATKYQTTMGNIRKLNNLKSDVLKPGDKLKVQ